MCLDYIINRQLPASIIGYKVVHVLNDEKNFVCGPCQRYGNPRYSLDKVNICPKKNLLKCDFDINQCYETGFHVFLKLEDAEYFANYKERIYKVYLEQLTAYGIDNIKEVCVGKLMTFLERIK